MVEWLSGQVVRVAKVFMMARVVQVVPIVKVIRLFRVVQVVPGVQGVRWSGGQVVNWSGGQAFGRSISPTGHCWATPTGPRPGGSSSFIEEWRKWTELASHEIFQADEELQSAEENKHSWCLSIGQAP